MVEIPLVRSITQKKPKQKRRISYGTIGDLLSREEGVRLSKLIRRFRNLFVLINSILLYTNSVKDQLDSE